ncbi:MAG: hypothetical protein QHG97_04290 [Methanolinea sp.]|jgi:hypothetical protein|nr:hypothetical protein [Methanolinea sp.]
MPPFHQTIFLVIYNKKLWLSLLSILRLSIHGSIFPIPIILLPIGLSGGANSIGMMQLPRGIFRSIEKGEKLGDFLKKLNSDQFSGVCSIACEGHTIEIVLEKGRFSLASCDNLSGDDAIGVIGGLMERPFDASISDLTPAQLKLSREFNEAFIVRNSLTAEKSIQNPQFTKDESIPAAGKIPLQKPEYKPQTVIPARHQRKPQDQDASKVQAAKSEKDSFPKSSVTSTATRNEALFETGEENINSPEQGYTLDDLDLKALDSMDLDVMSRKIRDNCKLMVERLHLGYLVVDEDKKESG